MWTFGLDTVEACTIHYSVPTSTVVIPDPQNISLSYLLSHKWSCHISVNSPTPPPPHLVGFGSLVWRGLFLLYGVGFNFVVIHELQHFDTCWGKVITLNGFSYHETCIRTLQLIVNGQDTLKICHLRAEILTLVRESKSHTGRWHEL